MKQHRTMDKEMPLPDWKKKSEAVGMSAERLARVERHMNERYVGPGLLPCVHVKVARRGTTVYDCVLGVADRERGTPLAHDTIHRIASMTKPITSVALLMLVEEGLVALDDPVHKFIPAWSDLGVFVSGTTGAFQTRRPAIPMRVIDLLRHTAGLTYGIPTISAVDAAYRQLGIFDRMNEGTIDDLIEKLATVPLECAPGEAYRYSLATDVIGYLIGKISGTPLDTFLAKRLFGPLGMVDTGFHVPADKHARLAACYRLGENGGIVLQDDPQTSTYLKPPRFVSGGGGLVGTASDYMRFSQMLLNGGRALDGTRLLGPKTIALMSMNHLPGGQELMAVSRTPYPATGMHGLGFGLGVACTIDVARTETAGSLGAYFWAGGCGTTFWCDPKEELAVVFMTQLIPFGHYPVARDLRTLVYAAIEEPNS